MREKDNKRSKAKEPATLYQKKLVFVSSFEEMNAYDIKKMASHTPVESLRNATALIKRLYADELNDSDPPKRLYFKKE